MIYKTSLFDIPIYKTTLLNQDKIKEKFVKEVMEKLTEIPPNNNNLNLYSDYFEGLDKLIEIKLNAPNFKFFAKKQANSFEKSVDLVFRALRKQILKIK